MWRPWEGDDEVESNVNACVPSTSRNKTITGRKRMGTLNKQSQKIICNVYAYVKSNKLGKGPITETAKAVGLSRQAVSRVVERGPKTSKKSRNVGDSKADSHDEMNSESFEDWFTNKLTKNLPTSPPCIIVTDNAACHSRLQFRLPNRSTRKDDIISFMVQHNLEVPNPLPTISVLLELIKEANISREFVIDKIARDFGHEVLRKAYFYGPRNCARVKRNSGSAAKCPSRLSYADGDFMFSENFDRTISSLTSVPGNVRDKVNKKTANILSKNPGYYELKEIQDILEGKTPQKPTTFSIEQLTAFVQAPLASCDVERSFSRYKAMLRENRRKMTTENIRHCLVVNCNSINGAFSNEASTSKSID
ncbi:hypothetical protein ANN_27159 [Periplaneta americana]|uniref:Uncharacterized protein n=1 Tax=Periplaneta americana TaxID=6978 RepID=A0ABQ8RXT6_PERAM|nr:hypothetical protein ANN_27159 [Periplaneta americana]